MPRNAHFWQVGLLDIVHSEYPDKSHDFRNFIFMTSHFSTLLLMLLYSLQFSAFTYMSRINYDSATVDIPVFIQQRKISLQNDNSLKTMRLGVLL